MAVDSSRPFPLIRNKSLNLGALVSRKEIHRYAGFRTAYPVPERLAFVFAENLSKKWLLDYIDLNVDDKTFSDEMTLSGSKVEGYVKEGADLTNIVVGKLLSLEKHPDSDHLWICQIDAGQGDPLQIVTVPLFSLNRQTAQQHLCKQ